MWKIFPSSTYYHVENKLRLIKKLSKMPPRSRLSKKFLYSGQIATILLLQFLYIYDKNKRKDLVT